MNTQAFSERIRLPTWLLAASAGLMLALGIDAIAADADIERHSAHNVRLTEPSDSARVIVRFKQDSAMLRKQALSAQASASETFDVVTARAGSLSARLGAHLTAGRALNEHTQVVSASGISGASLAKRLAEEADVEYAVVDQRRTHFAVPNDPLYQQGPSIVGSTGGPVAGQWYLHAPAGEIASSINAANAWSLTTGSSNIVVAVLDTGVRKEHPDLANRLLAGYDMISDAATANDGQAANGGNNNRDSDASDPGDWVTTKESNSRSSTFYQCGAEDSSWHGTMTSSLIGAASNDGVGMAGVAWGVKLLPVRVLGKCGGYDSDIIAGMQWAAGLPVPGVPTNQNSARVINMSLGGSGACTQAYLDAINAILGKQDPAVIVAAAGNSSGQAVGAPANCPGVIGVAGLRHIGTKVGFSDLGPEIAISAPGGNCVNSDPAQPCLYPILAATNTGTTTPLASSYTDAFNASTGTSFSAPLVAGTVALMLSVQPSLTPAQIKAALQGSARAFPTGVQTATLQNCHAPDGTDQLECYCTASTCGAGMLDAAAAVASVMPGSRPLQTSGADCVFNWAERTLPKYFAPAVPASTTSAPYYFRYYSTTRNYLATSSVDNHLWALGPDTRNNLLDLGPVASFLTTAGCSQ
ncbi:MAG: S8 family peptidase [Proteobacteria bacterium]|nr:S8 family peptidase [Pseudomonadota bacterium]